MDSETNVEQCRKVVDGKQCYRPLHHYGPCEALDLTLDWYDTQQEAGVSKTHGATDTEEALEGALADTERLDWLEAQPFDVRRDYGAGWTIEGLPFNDDGLRVEADTLREAIDAAMGAKEARDE